MIDEAGNWYRVQICGRRFNVSYEVRPEGEEGPSDVDRAALAIVGALAMASYELPRLTQILADVVSQLVAREACDIKTVRVAEDSFRAAANELLLAWMDYDAHRREECAS